MTNNEKNTLKALLSRQLELLVAGNVRKVISNIMDIINALENVEDKS